MSRKRGVLHFEAYYKISAESDKEFDELVQELKNDLRQKSVPSGIWGTSRADLSKINVIQVDYPTNYKGKMK